MTTGICAVVWIERDEARIIFLDANAGLSQTDIRCHRQAKPANELGRRATEKHVFYQKIANDLAEVRKFLILGPADTKTELVKHLHRFDPRLVARLSAIESMDRLTDEELLATAQAHFRRSMLPTTQPAFWSI